MDFSTFNSSANSLSWLAGFSGAFMAILAVSFAVFTILEWTDFGADRSTIITGCVSIGLAGLAWFLFSTSGDLNRDDSFAEEVERVYGITLTAEEEKALRDGQTHRLANPGTDFLILGQTLTLVNDEPERLTLAYLHDEWRLLQGDPTELEELARAGGQD